MAGVSPLRQRGLYIPLRSNALVEPIATKVVAAAPAVAMGPLALRPVDSTKLVDVANPFEMPLPVDVPKSVDAADGLATASTLRRSPLQSTRSRFRYTTCPGCGNIPLADSIFCRRCGHRLLEGQNVQSLEAELESLRALHVKEITWWQFSLENLRKENEALKLAGAQQENRADQSLQLSEQVKELSRQLAVSKREIELMREDLLERSTDLAAANRRNAELTALVEKYVENEGRFEEVLQSERQRISEEASAQVTAAEMREQALRGRCKLLQACCFRLWWCLDADLPGLDLASAAESHGQARQDVDSIPTRRMPLPADWRSILQFQAKLFHSFADASSPKLQQEAFLACRLPPRSVRRLLQVGKRRTCLMWL
ncbi:unnamed protein product [Effrenium voratum]|uniref:Uncharacterized protein n=1 Tax=Effrenium voratum TaxID=2562239 RepID=A0AA36IAX1_9DINO|nr:unnamed protein product [Effrenium voratum]